jgi:hypothetical protein
VLPQVPLFDVPGLTGAPTTAVNNNEGTPIAGDPASGEDNGPSHRGNGQPHAAPLPHDATGNSQK